MVREEEFFTIKVLRHWHSLLRKAVTAPSLFIAEGCRWPLRVPSNLKDSDSLILHPGKKRQLYLLTVPDCFVGGFGPFHFLDMKISSWLEKNFILCI